MHFRSNNASDDYVLTSLIVNQRKRRCVKESCEAIDWLLGFGYKTATSFENMIKRTYRTGALVKRVSNAALARRNAASGAKHVSVSAYNMLG
jgi:hypothetical protein